VAPRPTPFPVLNIEELETALRLGYEERSFEFKRNSERRLHWPRRGRLKWPHFASVVVGVDVV
jgi:hypothetical protein